MNLTREEFVAQVRHIGWVAYQIAVGQTYNEIANKDQLDSLYNGIAYADAHPGLTPEENHKNWMQAKEAQGWVYGRVKDFEAKTHPDLVPFNRLPVVEQRKDNMDYVIHRLACSLYEQLGE